MDFEKNYLNVDNEDDIFNLDEENKQQQGQETFSAEERFLVGEEYISKEENEVIDSQTKNINNEKNNNKNNINSSHLSCSFFGVVASVVSTVLIIGTAVGIIPALSKNISVSNFLSRSNELGFIVDKDSDKEYIMNLYNDDYNESLELTSVNEYIYSDLIPNTLYYLDVYDVSNESSKKVYSANYLTKDSDKYNVSILNEGISDNMLYLHVSYEGEGIDFVTVEILENNKQLLLYEGSPKEEFIVNVEDSNKDITCRVYVNGSITHFEKLVESQEEEKQDEPSEKISVESVSLSSKQVYLLEGDTMTLTATVLPENATDKSLNWESTNTSVVTVDNGLITAVGAGSSIIIVSTNDGGKYATCSITVNNSSVSVESVSLNKTSIELIVGETETLVPTILPEDATYKSVTWSSDDETVATVEDGVVTAVGEGETTITVTTVDGDFTDTCVVTVVDNTIHVTGVSFENDTESIEQKGTITLNPIVTPNNATNTSVTWESSDASIATVNSSGVVTGVMPGVATITVTTVDGSYTADCVITVTAIEPTMSNVFFYKNVTNYGNKIITVGLGYEDPSKVWNDQFYIKLATGSYDGDVLFEGEIKPTEEYYAALNKFILPSWTNSYTETLENTNVTYYLSVYPLSAESYTSEYAIKTRNIYGGSAFTNGTDPIPGSIILDETIENSGDIMQQFHIASSGMTGYDSIDVKFTNVTSGGETTIQNITLGEVTTLEVALPSGSTEFKVDVIGHKGDDVVNIISENVVLENNYI